MKLVIKAMAYGLILSLVLGFLALMAVIRFAPSDPALWNAAIVDSAVAKPGLCGDQVIPQRNGARATCLVSGDPTAVLTAMAAIAGAMPGTKWLAGTPSEGRMTWVSRSRIMGYPDYTTAQAVASPEGTRLEVFARQRFGNGDWGVNAARLKIWLGQL